MQANPIRSRGGHLTLDDVRRSGRPKGFEVLVDTGACVLGGDTEWCPVARLRSPVARFEIEVKLPSALGTGSYRAAEVQMIREATR